eukprot:scpid52772/ scgid5651/ Probable G-protein coupled receptor 133
MCACMCTHVIAFVARILAVIDLLKSSVTVTPEAPLVQISTPNLVLGAHCPGNDSSGYLIEASVSNETIATQVSLVDNNVEGRNNRFFLPKEATDRIAKSSTCPRPAVEFLVQRDDALYVTHPDGSDDVPGSYIGSILLSVSVRGIDSGMVFHEDKAAMQFQLSDDMREQDEHALKCVFWDTDRSSWSGDGCSMVNSTQGLVDCRCTHLTSFAVLIVPEGKVHVSHAHSITTIVCCSLSLLGLAVVSLSILCSKKQRAMNHQRLVLIQCVLLGGFLIIFLTLMNRAGGEFCAAISMLLHFLLLSQFVSTVAHAVFLMQRLIHVFEHDCLEVIKKLSVVAIFVVPIVVLSVCAGTTKMDGYGRRGSEDAQWCWLSNDVIYYGVYPIIGTALLFNGVVLAVVSVRLAKAHQQQRRKGPHLFLLRSAIVMSTLLGLIWLVGLALVAAEYDPIVQYIFNLLVSSQGVFMFIFLAMANKEMRHAWKQRVAAASRAMRCPRVLPRRRAKLSGTIQPYTGELVHEYSEMNLRRSIDTAWTTATHKDSNASGSNLSEPVRLKFELVVEDM